MANLIAKSALSARAPLTQLGTTLSQVDLGPITSVAPFAGREADLSKALSKSLGLAFPAPNSVTSKGDVRAVWSGRAQAFLIGAPCPDLEDLAAVTDQTDAWVALRLSGPAAADVLARYVPLDLRRFTGAARSQLYHMPLLLIGRADGFDILTFRSMARTAWHELEIAMKTLAARAP